MRILITGINGFIGGHLGRELLKRGHFVTGVGRNKKCKIGNIKIYYEGTVLDKGFVAKATETAEVIIHLASLTSHTDIADNKFITLETNFLGTKNVLDAFLKSKTTKKFLYASSGKVYGKIVNLPISENHQTNPLNILGKSKLITEKLIDFYSNNQKEFIVFRIFNIYGPGQNKNFLIPTILRQLSQKKREIVLGDTEAKRDYVYIEDLVRAFILAIENNGHFGVSIYNICTGIGSSASDIVNTINIIKGVDIRVIKKNPTLFRNDEMKNEYGSFGLAKKTFGWIPEVSLAEGLRRLLI